MLDKLKKVYWVFLAAWVIVNSTSIVMGFLVSSLIKDLVHPIINVRGAGDVTLLFEGIIIGIFNGAGQAIFLSTTPRKRFAWLVATGIGWGVGFGLIPSIIAIVPSSLFDFINPVIIYSALFASFLGAIVGIFVGMAQSLVLSKNKQYMIAWLITNLSAFALALLSHFILEEWIPYPYLPKQIWAPFFQVYRDHVINIVSLVILSITTGIGFLWLFRRPPAEITTPQS